MGNSLSRGLQVVCRELMSSGKAHFRRDEFCLCDMRRGDWRLWTCDKRTMDEAALERLAEDEDGSGVNGALSLERRDQGYCTGLYHADEKEVPAG